MSDGGNLTTRRELALRMTRTWQRSFPGRSVGPELTNGYLAGVEVHRTLHQLYQELTYVTHFHLRWAAFGFPVFQLSHGLAAKLLLTDPHGISWDEVRWPFDSFLIQLPGPEPLIVYEDDGKDVVADCIGVHQFTVGPIDADIDRYVSERGALGALDYITQPFVRETAWRMDAMSARSGLAVHRMMKAPEDEASMQALIDSSEERPDNLGLLPVGKRDELAIAAMLRLCLNFAVYLADLRVNGQWTPGDPPVVKRNAPPAPRKPYKLGGDVKLAPALRALARSDAQTDPKWHLQRRFLVRGHWRMQPHGPGRTERRRQFIAPFWKGPETGERFDRTYTLDDRASARDARLTAEGFEPVSEEQRKLNLDSHLMHLDLPKDPDAKA